MARNFDTTIESSKFRNGVITHNGQVVLDLRDDPRITRIYELAQAEIQKKGYKLPENEKEISEKVTELMHRKEFYGPYSDKSYKLQQDLGDLQTKITTIDLNKDNPDYCKREGKTEKQFEKELEGLKKQEASLKEKLLNDTRGRNIASLKDVKSGETVCFHQAAIVSHVMDKLGAKNDLCLGVQQGSIAIGSHAFVQSRLGKNNIIDSTRDIPYWYNTNGGSIRDAEIALVSETPHRPPGSLLGDYGGGKFPGFIQRHFPDKFLADQLEQDKPKTAQEAIQSVIYANRNREQDKPQTLSLPKDVDQQVLDIMKSLDKGIFGRGVISPEELEKGKSTLTEQQQLVLMRAGVSHDEKTSYDIRQPNQSVQDHSSKHNLGAPHRR